MQTESHFGLDTVTNIDSVVIKRPNGKKQVLLNITTNQTIKANIKDALEFELMDAWMRITVYKKDQMRNLFLYDTINIRNLPFQVLEMF